MNELKVRGLEPTLFKHNDGLSIDIDYSGYVDLIGYMGSDDSIANIARLSHGNKGTQDTEKTIKYLLDNNHLSPFEFAEFVFKIKAPIYVMRHIVRHRTASMLEISGRYTELGREYTLPNGIPEGFQDKFMNMYDETCKFYNEMLDSGVKKESARGILPVCTHSVCYWKIDARNLMNFLTQRTAKSAQSETRHYANAIESLASLVLPLSISYYVMLRESKNA